jgi:hypothetical protein
VRISENQQIFKFKYQEITLQETKTKYPKQFYLLTEIKYRQVLIEEAGRSMVIFKTDKFDKLGLVTIHRSENYHHFDFTITHPMENCSFSIHSKGKTIDYQMFSLESLPIAEEADTLLIPIRFPILKTKGITHKATAFFKFEVITYVEEDVADEYTSGVFVIQRIKSKLINNGEPDAKLKANYGRYFVLEY